MRYAIVENDKVVQCIDARSPKHAAKKFFWKTGSLQVTVKNTMTQFTKTYAITQIKIPIQSAFELKHNITHSTQAQAILVVPS